MQQNFHSNIIATLSIGARAIVLPAAMFLNACATQPAYEPVHQEMPTTWSVTGNAPAPADAARNELWWTSLADPAINVLVQAALANSPTLAQAVARIDQARAGVRTAAAAGDGLVSGGAAGTRARQAATAYGAAGTSSTETVGLNLSWELDLWGRIRESRNAAVRRLDARTFDSQEARLSLAAQVADAVLDLRACNFSLYTRAADIASRERQLALTRQRLAVGYVAPVEEARSMSGLANARTDFISRQQQCLQTTNSLVALTGTSVIEVARRVGPRLSGTLVADADAGSQGPGPAVPSADVMPSPPPLTPQFPAVVLAAHPDVAAAEREVAAAWADIAVQRANRLPKIDLLAALGGQWLQAAGSAIGSPSWSLGPSLSVPIVDGGNGAAMVSSAEAAYHLAVATLRSTVRTTVQNVEDALAARRSADGRALSTRDAAEAALRTLTASDAQWRVGSISLFELEDDRRTFTSAQESAIAAARDRAQAWVSLVRASGNTVTSL